MNWMDVQKIVGKRGGRGLQLASTGRRGGRRTRGGQQAKEGKARSKELDELQPIDAERKVWVAGLDESMTKTGLEEHFSSVGKVKAAMMRKGKACLAFDSADEAKTAIETMNGSSLGDKKLELDVWTARERPPREPRGEGGEKRGRGGKRKGGLVKTGFAAKVAASRIGAAGRGVTSKFWEKLKAMDIEQKIKVSNLPKEVTPQKLKAHLKEHGAECKVLEIMVKDKGTACVGFNAATDATNAIDCIQNTELCGQAIEVAPWTVPERRPRKGKTDGELNAEA